MISYTYIYTCIHTFRLCKVIHIFGAPMMVRPSFNACREGLQHTTSMVENLATWPDILPAAGSTDSAKFSHLC